MSQWHNEYQAARTVETHRDAECRVMAKVRVQIAKVLVQAEVLVTTFASVSGCVLASLRVTVVAMLGLARSRFRTLLLGRFAA